VDELYAPYAVRADDPARLPMTLEEAAAHVSAFHGSPVRAGHEFDASEALEAATWWYVPYGWIGCCGFVVEKRTGQVHQMGSNAGLETYLWAQDRGLLVEYADLVIDEVHDPAATAAALRKIVCIPSGDHYPLCGPGSVYAEALLATLPARVPAQRLGLWLPRLREAVDGGLFTCHMEPPTGATLRPGAWHVVLDVGAIRAVALDRGLCERLHDRVIDLELGIDATEGLRRLTDSDLPEVPATRPLTLEQLSGVRAWNRIIRQRERVPWRLVGGLPRNGGVDTGDEAAQLAATFSAGGATTLVTTDVASAAAKVAAEIRVIDLAALIAHVGDAAG
jgi:hypothetical protein